MITERLDEILVTMDSVNDKSKKCTNNNFQTTTKRITSKATVIPILFLYVLIILIATGRALPLEGVNTDPPRSALIGLLHMHDGVSFFQRLGALTGRNKERYARRHGYDFIQATPRKTKGIFKRMECPPQVDISNSNGMIRGPDAQGHCWVDDESFDIDHSRAPTFGKIKLALSSCLGRDNAWLLWSDADAIIVNQSLKMESIIDDSYDILYSVDWLMLNAGMLLVKCSPWSIQFLTTVYNSRKFDMARALDQSSLQSHIDNLNNIEKGLHIKILPKFSLDTYTEEYLPGDFMIHFAGKLYEATEPGLFSIVNQFDILSLCDDIEDIEAFFRGRRFLNYYSGTCDSTIKGGTDCKSDDTRRIIPKEPLGSMSHPNRYRHVGLRYFWLKEWKDVYDVPGWNSFKRPLIVSDSKNDDTDFVGGFREDSIKEDSIKEDSKLVAEMDEEDNVNVKNIGRKVHDFKDGDDDNDNDSNDDATDDDDKGKADGDANADGDDDKDEKVGNGGGEGDAGGNTGGGDDDKDNKEDKAKDDESDQANKDDDDDDDKHKMFSWQTLVLSVGCLFALFGIYSTLKARTKMLTKTH